MMKGGLVPRVRVGARSGRGACERGVGAPVSSHWNAMGHTCRQDTRKRPEETRACRKRQQEERRARSNGADGEAVSGTEKLAGMLGAARPHAHDRLRPRPVCCAHQSNYDIWCDPHHKREAVDHLRFVSFGLWVLTGGAAGCAAGAHGSVQGSVRARVPIARARRGTLRRVMALRRASTKQSSR